MAPRKKKDTATAAAPAPIQEATKNAATLQEAEATQEAHLDPAQFEDMNDDDLRGLAQDLGLDPAAYDNRDALIAAIAAVPVIPGPPEAEEDPEAPAQEPPADTTPAPEAEQPPEADQEEPPAPVPPGERPLPYKAAVAVSLATLHKAIGIGTADMLKVVGTLRQGAEVTVTDRNGPYCQIKNGLWILEAFLEVQTIS